ncbi:MAG TPA: radical SAM protein [Candidatus Omnitrophota bacterium]|nr:radical SAM protein [Candidatus Omnitrophota bacterium]
MQKHIILIRPSYSKEIYKVYGKLPRNREVRPPLGLLYIAGALEQAGHTVRILDAEPPLLTTEQVLEHLQRMNTEHPIDHVGITATTPEFFELMAIARGIKARLPHIKIIAGGAHVSALPEESLKLCPEIDYLICNEGEELIVDAVERSPSHRVLRGPLLTDLDRVKPARHLLDYDQYKFPVPGRGMLKMDVIESSRGCPGGCRFCAKRKVPYRCRDPLKVVDEIESSYKNYGTEFFLFFDDTFTVSKKFVLSVCDEIISRGLNKKITFYVNTRANTIDREMLLWMKQAGMTEISMGVETGHEQFLKDCEKGTTQEQYRTVYRWMRELGLQTRGSFIVGFPWETRETVRETIDFARSLDLMRASCNIMTPYPGTEIFKQALRKDGIEFVTDLDWGRFKRWAGSCIRTPSLSASEIEESQRLFLTLFYTQPKVLLYHFLQVLRGNFALYYYRPVLFAIKNRIAMIFRRGHHA